MGNALSSCPCRRNRISSMKEITLLMIGLDNAGKSCTAKHLLGEPTCDVVPTVGFTSVHIRHGKFNICVYDVGGGPKIRGIWKNYYALVHGVIFVVDASEPQRFEECKSEIRNVLTDERIAGKPILLLFNKQDLDSAVNETELVNQLDLEALVNEQHCPTRIEASCAIYDQNKVKDPGIQAGFNWLIGHIGKEFGCLSERVEKEREVQMKREQIERELRMERVRKIREERERIEKEKGSGYDNACLDNDEDDDNDVIVGNPFRPVNVIKSELEEREKSKTETMIFPNSVKVIHVSPTHSAGGKEELVLQPKLMQSPIHPVENRRELMTLSSQDIRDETLTHAFSVSHSFKPSKSEEDVREKKRLKKPKKRFKNRVVPQCESVSHQGAGELPPLKSQADVVVLNGYPRTHSSPKHYPLNGTMLHM